jgi:chromosome segregation ATPase
MITEIQKLKTMLMPLEEELRMVKGQYSDASKELEISRKTVFSLENKIMTFENDLLKAKQSEEHLHNEIRMLKDRHQGELKERDDQISQLTIQIRELNVKIGDFSSKEDASVVRAQLNKVIKDKEDEFKVEMQKLLLKIK